VTEFFDVETPLPTKQWTEVGNGRRLELVVKVTEASGFKGIVRPVSALPTGFVYVDLISPLRAADRGIKLREYEALLKSSIDESLTVWCEPVGDKSALRKLRGIEVKAL
jgi:hypothetical protein